MNSKLPILLFLAALLFTAHCSCPSGYFTNNNPCDTKATLLQSTKSTSNNIGGGNWHYYYLPLAGIDENFGLSFQVGASYLEAFMDFQKAGQYQLPDDNYFDYAFYVQDGDRTIPYQILTYGMENKDKGKMLLGIYNPYSSTVNVQIRYFNSEDDKTSIDKFVIGIIITVFTVIFAMFCLAVIVHRIIRRRREIVRRQNFRLESEAQGILISPVQGNNAKSADALTLEEFQRYFPKKPFGELENQFQQTGCSVCLEDFSAETLCYQFYCNHIFHEACIQQWLEKKNSCPACRVPLGKKAIEEFLEVQKKQNEVNLPENIEIKIQDQEVANEQENNN